MTEIKADQPARGELTDAALDALLARLPPAAGPSPELIARIVATAPGRLTADARCGSAVWPTGRFAWLRDVRTAAAAASLAAGLGFGYVAGAGVVDAATAEALWSVGEVDLETWSTDGEGETP